MASGSAVAVVVASAAGLGGAVQAAVMGELGDRVGIVPAVAVSVLVSLACGMVALLVWERSFAGLRAAAHEPAWLWIGGVMSVFIIFAVTIGPPRIGVTATVAVVIAGNLVSAAIIDRFGLFGVERVGLGWPRVLGFVLLALGAALTLRR
ncbi:MAG TPA: DMT family transporter [Gaiellaceae bacterium]|jgi:transporter family-2 protein